MAEEVLHIVQLHVAMHSILGVYNSRPPLATMYIHVVSYLVA